MSIHRLFLIWAIVSCVSFGSMPLGAVETLEEPTEATVRDIAKSLRCAVCQNQSVYESNSDLAKDMLSVIRTKVAAGEQEGAIRDYFFQRYGDYIYLEPTTQGGNGLLWWGPFLALLLGGIALFSALKKWRRETPVGKSPSMDTDTDTKTFQNRLKNEMEQID
ncbi:MAG: cytochrome c-type biogenesis protein CcmH [Nitrospirae bacterium]|nr:cytochrome c-type biogenesis protein CcmH [Magnetococcales bacterium]HAT49384.1 cytochrome C biogenesis protein CcdA [Alphaproteobacteria bacterium]